MVAHRTAHGTKEAFPGDAEEWENKSKGLQLVVNREYASLWERLGTAFGVLMNHKGAEIKKVLLKDAVCLGAGARNDTQRVPDPCLCFGFSSCGRMCSLKLRKLSTPDFKKKSTRYAQDPPMQ